jgi:hypothetical protein
MTAAQAALEAGNSSHALALERFSKFHNGVYTIPDH